MLMVLGQFVFQPDALSFNELQRQRAWNFADNAVASGRSKKQFIGAGEDNVTLSGIVVQEHGVGTRDGIEQLADMADSGQGYVLMDGSGYLYGVYIITGIDETKQLMIFNGIPRKIDFSIKLTRVDDNRIERQQVPVLNTAAAAVNN